MDYEQLKALIEQRGVHTVFGPSGEGWFIEQNAHELATFLVHMQQLGVQSVLEVGTGWKAGLARFLHDDLGWQVTSLDVQDYGHAFDGITFLVAPAEQEWQIPTTFDLVMIDADHSYSGVQHDHATYAPYANKVIAFHDIAGLRDCEGVRQYWDELANYETAQEGRIKALMPGYYEVIAEGDQRGGIGYIVLSEVHTAPEPKLPAEVKKPAARKRAPAKKPAAKATAKK